MSDLTGKVAIVTGSSRGIGRGIAERLARDGASVVINYNQSADTAQAVVAGITASGGTAIAIQADTANLDDIRRLFAETVEQFGQPDILINNAGTAVFKSVAEATEADFDRVFALNAKDTYFCLQEGVKQIRDGGRIVCISSALTVLPLTNLSLYCGSKGAIEQFVRVLAKELGTRGITVNTILPGATDTEAFAQMGAEIAQKNAQMSPFDRLGVPGDIADAVAFVVSEEARWITGHNLLVDGGYQLFNGAEP